MNTEQTSESIFTYSTLKLSTHGKVKLQKNKLTAFKSMPNGKSPGHDGLTKEFYERFWNDLKVLFHQFI